MRTSQVRPARGSLTVGEIESEIESMKAEGAQTEAWMSARARNKMRELENRDAALRDAFEAGYRMGHDMISPLPLFFLALAVAIGTLVVAISGDYVVRIPTIPPPAASD